MPAATIHLLSPCGQVVALGHGAGTAGLPSPCSGARTTVRVGLRTESPVRRRTKPVSGLGATSLSSALRGSCRIPTTTTASRIRTNTTVARTIKISAASINPGLPCWCFEAVTAPFRGAGRFGIGVYSRTSAMTVWSRGPASAGAVGGSCDTGGGAAE